MVSVIPPDAIRILISGSRRLVEREHREWMLAAMRGWLQTRGFWPRPVSDVWHGACKGADSNLASALERYPQVGFGACWEELEAAGDDKFAAGPVRNEHMLIRAWLERSAGRPLPILFAFPDHDSKGTWHAVRFAAQLGIWPAVFPYPNPWRVLTEVCETCFQRACEGCPARSAGKTWITPHILKTLRKVA